MKHNHNRFIINNGNSYHWSKYNYRNGWNYWSSLDNRWSGECHMELPLPRSDR